MWSLCYKKNIYKKILDFSKNIECNKIQIDVYNSHTIELYKKFRLKKDEVKYILF